MSDATIEQRLIRLELSARRWRRGCVGLAVAGVLAVGVGAIQVPKPGVVKATKLVIVDRNGNEGAVMQDSDGLGGINLVFRDGGFVLFKEGNQYVAGIGSLGSVGRLYLASSKGKSKVELGMDILDDDTTEGFVRIVGPKGQDRVTLGNKD